MTPISLLLLLSAGLWPAHALAAPTPGPEDVGPVAAPAPLEEARGGAGVAEAPRSLQDIGIEMTNPLGSVFSVFNTLEFTGFQGDLDDAGDQTRLQWDIMVSWPFMLNNGKRIVARVNFPINLGEPTYFTGDRDYVDWGIRQDADILPNGNPWFDGHSHLSDVSWDVTWGGVNDAGWLTGIGIAGVLPTGQDGSIERDQYLLGPDIVLGKVSDWGIIGARLRHLTDVSNVSSAEEFITWETNETHIEFFLNHPLGSQWSLVSSPTVIYDWEATSGNKLLFPLGGGVSRMMRWFGLPMQMDFELEYYVASPDIFGPEWLARFSLSPAILDRAGR